MTFIDYLPGSRLVYILFCLSFISFEPHVVWGLIYFVLTPLATVARPVIVMLLVAYNDNNGRFNIKDSQPSLRQLSYWVQGSSSPSRLAMKGPSPSEHCLTSNWRLSFSDKEASLNMWPRLFWWFASAKLHEHCDTLPYLTQLDLDFFVIYNSSVSPLKTS